MGHNQLFVDEYLSREQGPAEGGLKGPYGPGLQLWGASSDQKLRRLSTNFNGFLAKLPTFPIKNN